MISAEKKRDVQMREEGQPPYSIFYMREGGGFLPNFLKQHLKGEKRKARGGVSKGRNSGHQDNDHNSIKRLLTYSVTQGEERNTAARAASPVKPITAQPN